MATKAFEEITREDFEAYEKIRCSGAINMIMESLAGRILSGLDRPTYMGVMTHYSALMEKFPDVRNNS